MEMPYSKAEYRKRAELVNQALVIKLEPDWKQRAACSFLDSNAFFPTTPQEREYPLSICAECVVRVECLAVALKEVKQFGIWGGYPAEVRTRMRRTWIDGRRRLAAEGRARERYMTG